MVAIHSLFYRRLRKLDTIRISTVALKDELSEAGHSELAIGDAVLQFVQGGYLREVSWHDGEVATPMFGGPSTVSGVHKVHGLEATAKLDDWRPPLPEAPPADQDEEPSTLEQQSLDVYDAAATKLGRGTSTEKALKWAKDNFSDFDLTLDAFKKRLSRGRKKQGRLLRKRRSQKTPARAVPLSQTEVEPNVGKSSATLTPSGWYEDRLSDVGDMYEAEKAGEDLGPMWKKLKEQFESNKVGAAILETHDLKKVSVWLNEKHIRSTRDN
jgi:hypothetical protein